MSANTDKVILRDPLTGAIKQLDYSTSVVAQDIQNAAGDKASYQFSNLSVISLATNQVLMGTGDFTLLSTVKPTGVSATESRIFQIYGSAGVNSAGFILLPDLRVVFQTYNGTSDLLYTAPQPLGNWGTYIAKRASGATSLFVNGLQVASGTSIKDIGNSTGNYIAGNTTSGYSFLGQQNRHLLFNYALSAEKIARYSAGAKLDYEDVGGSMVDLSTSSIWAAIGANNNYNTFTPSGNNATSITSDGTILRYALCSGFNIIAGKTYRVYYNLSLTSDIAPTFGFINNVQTQNISNTSLTVNGLNYVDLVVTLSDASAFLRMYNNATATNISSLDIIKVVQLGAVLDLEPEGITTPVWVDSSGNGLNGTVTGAIPTNNQVNGTWTPNWGASGTSPSLGNGALTGVYSKNGSRIDFRIKLVIGTTTTLGSGYYIFTLPIVPSDTLSNAVGVGVVLDEGVGSYPLIVVIGMVASAQVSAYYSAGSGITPILSNSVPFTLGNTDQIILQGSYKV